MDRQKRRSQVLAPGDERAEDPRHAGHPDRDRRWAEGLSEAITAAFPEAMVQTLNFCSWKDRKAVAADLRRIYGAATADLAAAEIDDFEEKWAIEAAFPQTRVQTCIVHLLRHCMNFARFKWEAIDPVDQSSRRTGPQGRRRRPQGDLHGRGCWRRRAGPG